MSEVNFEVRQDGLDVIRNTSIDANFDECRAALTELIAPYASLVVSAEDIASAKADRAKIRKVAARVDEVRKTIKSEYQKPLIEFEDKCRELVAICTAGADNLDKQIKEIEGQEAAKKIEQLHAEYDAMADDELQSYLPWGVVNNPRFANKSFAFDAAVEEIKTAIENTRRDIETIRAMGGDDTPYLLDVYRQTRDLSAVVRKASDLKTMRQREEQREREAERIRQAQEANTAAAKTSETVYEAQPGEEEIAQAEMYRVAFRVNCTKQQLIKLGAFLRDNGIYYEKV